MIEALKVRGIPICAVDVPSGLDGANGEIRGTAAPADRDSDLLPQEARSSPVSGTSSLRQRCPRRHRHPRDGAAEDRAADIRKQPHAVAGGLSLAGDRRAQVARRGHALILGGEAITGAARLAALSALRAGAGLVTLAAPAPIWTVYAAALTSVIVRSFNGLEGFDALLADERKNAIAIGPGAGVGEATRQYVWAALATKRAVVLDADALTSFAEAREDLFRAVTGPCVLTPHEGEFARLFDFTGDKLTRARKAAAKSNAVVLLKGPDTVIAAPDGRAAINTNAPPQLATGGTGDVLTGLIAGLMAQGVDAFQAASAGVWLHGEAAAAIGLGLIAEDLPDVLPRVLQQLKGRSDQVDLPRLRCPSADTESS